jgi:hypothetical protein
MSIAKQILPRKPNNDKYIIVQLSNWVVSITR